MTDPQQQLTDLIAFDREHLWHPYSSALTPSTPYLVESASGVRLRLRLGGEAGNRAVDVIDAMSSWWCAIHGYAVPSLDQAVHDQLGRMSHVMFGGLTHEPAVALGRKLIELAPRLDGQAESPLQHVFLADSGSVSVEVALKMAWQFHVNTGRPRTKMFTIRGGYHGDTFAPMSICDPVGGMHSLFTGVLPEQIFAPGPPAGLDLSPDDPAMVSWEQQTRALYAAHAPDVAAVVVEPVLQGAGGMHIYSPYAVGVLASLAREHGALLILDEIATGFGRTGTLWAAERCGVVPDILTVGKALTGGYLTLAATLCTREVAERVSGGLSGALMHGPTFMGNPLACSVALASLELLERNDFRSQTARIESELSAGLKPALDLDCVKDVRTLGAVGVIQLTGPVDVAAIGAAAIRRGVWVRPFRDLVYTMPPYVSTTEDIAAITSALVGSVADVHGTLVP
ncbi:MAG: adenosylmethionine---8-amino-7-oxononanoate aminotransferase [Actinomycetota bacterium]|jgi:adenosylmethionine-8-amino-7-oxononanoate aminotransferase|nr:adenosylmethionine---8-amino-7-oxononanoate aminotransferase [Actinomycetota bacterium]